ncbi:TaqI-like C-terminal specificity domain-containing protein [Rothia nasimurium]|uniref:TaqI-like C-terminal specificity domain-containing protein n=1 Tax=Rothia nasimurium TaxID=85336 RepID=UPI001623F35F|nr:TaqI-like C-terminal specificity domain-containing protein [Rothia nasimurium]
MSVAETSMSLRRMEADSGKYGAVYTPKLLADFVANLCWDVVGERDNLVVLDPSSGELALLKAALGSSKSLENAKYIGIDIDPEAISASSVDSVHEFADISLINDDFIKPRKARGSTTRYWENNIGLIDLIISNPPWSSDRRYSLDYLQSDGFTLAQGQYDAYILFIEQSMRLLVDGGIAAFILPDSLFSNTNTKLRKFVATNFKIRVIARLGEKLFPEVNRSTAIIILEKSKPVSGSVCTCFRLDTDSRRKVLGGTSDLHLEFRKNQHKVKQSRFSKTENYAFDIDTKEHEESLVAKLHENCLDIDAYFQFSRGVEISKTGMVAVCEHCKHRQGVTPAQLTEGKKTCQNCGKYTSTGVTERLLGRNNLPGTAAIFVGEDVQRYGLARGRFIKLQVPGIAYKKESIYRSPKLLIRKTGLGIKASLDTDSTLVTQTVYMLMPRSEKFELEELWYYLALLNSRVVFYFYLKTFGENEWKSHPYLTKQTLFQLPLKDAQLVERSLVRKVAELAKKLQNDFTREVDLQLEKLVFQVYEVSEEEQAFIREELGKLPNLSAINEMKF